MSVRQVSHNGRNVTSAREKPDLSLCDVDMVDRFVEQMRDFVEMIQCRGKLPNPFEFGRHRGQRRR
jgi:hypothetical protein